MSSETAICYNYAVMNEKKKSKRIQSGKSESQWSEVQSGAYRNYYLIYNRKSTDEADNQKNSIDYQRNENTRYALSEQLPTAPLSISGFCTDGIVSERHSGFKEDDDLTILDNGVVQYRIERPKFQKVLQLLSKGQIKGIVCLCWDRLSRNKGDDTALRKLMRGGADVRFVYARYDNSSAGALHMDIDSMFAHHHSRVTSEKVTLTTRNNRRKGKCTYRAPMGYLNEGNVDYKPHDPERAPIITRLFELYATGEWTLADLVRYARAQGLTTRPMRRRRTPEEMLSEEDELSDIPKVARPVTEGHISRILRNPFYAGKVLGPDGMHIESTSHQPLVSRELFDRVQAELARKKVSIHYDVKLDHPFRGFIRCAACKRVYTPYEKKGNLYVNARCLRDCTNERRNYPLSDIESKIGTLIAKIHFSDDELNEIDARIETNLHTASEQRHVHLDAITRKKKHIRENLKYLDENRIELLKSGVYTPRNFVIECDQQSAQLAALRAKEEISDVMMRETIDEVVKISELLKSIVLHYNLANLYEKERIARSLFSELTIAGNALNSKLKTGLEAFESRFSAVDDLITWLSELCVKSKEIQVRKHIIKNILENK